LKEEEEKELGDKMDEDYEMGNEFKDQLIPLALEYYLEVIEHEEGDDEEGDSGDEDDDDKGGKPSKDKDSDEDKPKGGKKKGATKGAKEGGDK